MRYIYIILFMQIICSKNYCQVGSNVFVTASQLNVRSEPSMESLVIGKLRHNDLVKIIAESNKDFTIDGIQSKWKEVEYGKIKGYVFGGYLSGNRVITNEIDTFDIVLDMLYDLNYNPSLNWYGVYSTHHGDKIEVVTPKPYLNKKYEDLTGISFLPDTIKNYKFFIGTKEEIENSVVGVTTYYKDKWLTGKQSVDLVLYNNKREFIIGQKLETNLVQLSEGTYGDKSFENYVLRYFDYSQVEHGESVVLYQPKANYLNQIPILEWYGDIDNDGLPEFLFSVNGDNRGEDIEFIKIVRENNKLKRKRLISKRPEFAGGC